MSQVKPSVVVLDYGSGNVRSAVRALERAGADVTLSSERSASNRGRWPSRPGGRGVFGVHAGAECFASRRDHRSTVGRREARPWHLRGNAGDVRAWGRARRCDRWLRRVAGPGGRTPGSGVASHGLEHGGRAAMIRRSSTASRTSASTSSTPTVCATWELVARPQNACSSGHLGHAWGALRRCRRERAAHRHTVPPGEVRRRWAPPAPELVGHPLACTT